ncbi:MAG: hypothetical protein JJT76_06275 [Clostridiaceae bacterium]|nr:hypothetical protein [Clostridiaceae bacterium]
MQFQECSLEELAKRRDYYVYLSLLKSKEKHRCIQTLLCELGISLGFHVKLALNDESKILHTNLILARSKKFLDFYDLNLSTIVEKQTKKDINYIGVLWCDPLNQKVIVAFDVELSGNYSQLFQRFSSLAKSTSYPLHFIGVGDDFTNFRNNFNRPIWQSAFSSYKFGYLDLDELCDILTFKRELGSSVSSLASSKIVFEKLINDKSLPVIPFM